MALRKIVQVGDPILRKHCKEVKEVTDKTRMLIDDMIETMHDSDGVGLAAPQVGVLRRIFVVDVGEGPIVLVNPEIVETSGEQTGSEGCLSIPGRYAEVTRPNHVKIRGLDRDGNSVEYEGDELLARAFLHENDHLDGILYTDKVEEDEVYLEEE